MARLPSSGPLRILFWRCVAALSVALGIIGAFLPVLPTVPFMLLAAWAGSKGWPELEQWLLRHPVFGDPIRRWRNKGTVSRKAKYCAVAAMTLSSVVLQFLPLPAWGHWLRWGTPLVLLCVAIWLWMRPEE